MFVGDARRLGADVEKSWEKTGNDAEVFPEIAGTAIERHALHERFDQLEFATWFGRSVGLHSHLDTGSASRSPSLTLWRNDRFVVDLQFWSAPDTTFRDHGYSGAFAILTGETIHCIYRLEFIAHPEPGIMLAKLDLETVDQLREGMVQSVYQERPFIHRPRHIDRPTVTLSVRSIPTPLPVGHYEYYRPGFAIEITHTRFNHDPFKTEMAFMHYLADTDPHQLEWYIEQVTDHSQDRRLTFRLVLSLFDRVPVDVLEHLALINRLLDRLQDRYGAWVDAFGVALEHRLREKQVEWSVMHDVDHRLLAVLLQTYGERSAIDDAVRRFRGVDRTDIWIAERLKEMIAQGAIRLSMEDFQYNILRDLILGWSETDVIAVAMSRSNMPTSPSRVREFCAALRKVDVLEPLFAGWR